ncbi:glycosyltransferase family 2 protein [uncultured Draconibacterium sp.]|uniref:glycosyltransferase n=1 Tax=uncultured Draconibacterium sp. TaxID=1573823 RepID=UPI002AA7EC47|nr:glycosyltransferase family 2 protein [uncultured Draconibacterium sp.]
MEILKLLITIIEYVFFIYFGFAALYVLLFAAAGLFPHRNKKPGLTSTRKFAVLIPGYKEDAVIVEVAREALKQDYPQASYDVVIIADSFKKETLQALAELPVKVIEVSFEVSTKSKALNKAMQELGDDYDVALILDADNMMAPDFISKVNQAFDNGFSVVQGHRVAKNTNTSFAVLDAISEEVNNHIFRKGHRVLGFSSALIGSGMAFDYMFFKNTMANVKAIGGFDKELELKLLKGKNKIEYLPDAIVLDEKVQKSEVFQKQRKRWLSAQFVYFGRYFFPGLYHLFFKGNLDFFDKVYQMVSPPRILLVGLVTLLTAFYTIVAFIFPQNDFLQLSVQQWLPVFAAVVVAFLFSIPRKFYKKETLIAILSLPKAFALMFLSLFKLKGANKKFIHTEHGVTNN